MSQKEKFEQLGQKVREAPASPEKESRAIILCLCHGNVLRSQWAEFFLELLGINAISAALGDVSKQNFQNEVPGHILLVMREIFGFFGPMRGKKIKQVDEVMFNQATDILVFTDPKYLADYPFIIPSDPRIKVMQTMDPFGNIGQYENVLLEIANMALNFLKDNLKQELPEELQSISNIGSLQELSILIKSRVNEWKSQHEELFSKPGLEYFLSKGTGKLGILDKIRTWITWHKDDDFFPQGVNKSWYPSKDQCNEIVNAIELSNFGVAKQIFEDLCRLLEARKAGIQHQLIGLNENTDSKYIESLQHESQLISQLLSEYKSYISDLSE